MKNDKACFFGYSRLAAARCLAMFFLFLPLAWAADKAPPTVYADWTKPVPGHVAPAPGEHPRLFFRVADLPRLRERAATPEGQAIVKRLRLLLDGGDGTSLPQAPAANVGEADDDDPVEVVPYGKAYTLWHGAGYGLLYQLTGEARYADLGKAAVEIALKLNQTDFDRRYSFTKMTGALRNGPTLSSVAIAYDLCYSGWDATFRDRVRKELEFYDPGKELGKAKKPNGRIEDLARGSRHGPTSNHWGPQIGGAAIALWALKGDPGVDDARIENLLTVNKQCILRQLAEGQGDHGYYEQHIGAGQITTDTAFLPGLQAWKVAGGTDFVSGHTEVPWCTLRFAMTVLPTPRGPEYITPVRVNSYGGQRFARNGLSRGGQFCQGFGLVPAEDLPLLRWTYENLVEPGESAANPDAGLRSGERSFDLLSRYPHRAILALANWPIGISAQNPATRLPRQVSDQRLQWHLFRNRWQDGDDILAGVLLGADESSYFGDALRLRIWGLGRRYAADFPKPATGATVTPHGKDAWSAAWPSACLGVDFAPGEGLEAVFLFRGAALAPDLPELQVGAPEAFDPSGEWRMGYGPVWRCERQEKKALLYDTVRREINLDGVRLKLILGDRVMEGTVSNDYTTITWKAGTAWKRGLPKSEPGEELTGYRDISGEWKTNLTADFANGIVRLRLENGKILLERPVRGEFRWKGSDISLTTFGAKGASSRQGTLSSCGNLIDWCGSDQWRRVGSPALKPATWGGADDPKSRLTLAKMAGQDLAILTFSSAGRHPVPVVTDTTVTIGQRIWRFAQDRLTPAP